ncbi:MAG: hypothetical protein IJF47_05720, partial [Candidatus Methanomethylophilaceae archaeon]|nr:hypothetical protein [Candidatus Methanomethylophilaceae archaeon]
MHCRRGQAVPQGQGGRNQMSDLKYDANGLIPVVVQDHITGEVLMVAWSNEEAVEKMKETGYTHFWSRSRQKLWKKG